MSKSDNAKPGVGQPRLLRSLTSWMHRARSVGDSSESFRNQSEVGFLDDHSPRLHEEHETADVPASESIRRDEGKLVTFRSVQPQRGRRQQPQQQQRQRADKPRSFRLFPFRRQQPHSSTVVASPGNLAVAQKSKPQQRAQAGRNKPGVFAATGGLQQRKSHASGSIAAHSSSSPLVFNDLYLPSSAHAQPSHVLKSAAQEHAEFFKMADAHRANLIDAVNEGRTSQVIAARVNEYMPYLVTCADIAEDFRLRSIEYPACPFVWKSALSPCPESPHDLTRQPSIDGGFPLELVYVLTIYGLAAIRAVLEIPSTTIMSEDVSELKCFRDSLREAAGVFEFLANKAVPSAQQFCSTAPTSELIPDVHHALSILCLALAQMVCVRIFDRSANEALHVACFGIGVVDLCIKAEKVSRSLSSHLFECVAEVSAQLQQLVRPWCQKLLAEADCTAGSYGAAVVRMRLATRDIQHIAASNGLFQDIARKWLPDYQRLSNEYDSENQKIYYNPEPSEDELQLDVESGRIFVSPNAYEPPQNILQ